MKRKKILYVALFIAAFSAISGVVTYAAGMAMPSGTVVIGNKAFDLSYANDSKNINEITSAIVAGGNVYVKGFNAKWVNNNTASTINASIVPNVTYKSETGTISTYLAGDVAYTTPVVDEFKILSID